MKKMVKQKVILWMSVLFFWVTVGMPASAQVEEAAESTGGGALNGLLKVLGDAAQDALEDELQEEIDDWAGTYKGRIGEVRLLERRGNAVTFEVTYQNVKRRDGVHVTGEVLKWGEVQDGFRSTLSPIQEKTGSVRMTIGYDQQDESGWGLPSDDVTTDQIRLSLVRETNPERPFGTLVYDFQKTWTDSSDIEALQEATEVAEAEEDAIELAEGETTEESQNTSSGGSSGKSSTTLARPGSIILPNDAKAYKPAVSRESSASQPPPPTASSNSSQTIQTPVVGSLAKMNYVPTVTEYNLYENAGSATWTSASGELKYPGSSNDSAGFVKTIENGKICPGNNAMNLLETHPQWVDNGWIEGRYPAMILGGNLMFKTTGALLKGAEGSDGVVMSVSVFHENSLKRVARKRISTQNYTAIEADLSEWKGKKVQIVLKVRSGRTSTKDWAVWVNPRLTSK
jgi:hypothetical protein